jgi:glycosyltransferase involved in cell wall biosynthesis
VLTGEQKKLSAIIACYRDALAIPIMHARLTEVFGRLGVDHEIIFVNDGSPDDTAQVLVELAARDSHVVAINHSRNFGSQSAFTSGMQIATGDAVILLDGDLQDPPEIIEQFYARWIEGYDVVYGDRVQRETTFFLGRAYKLFYRIFRAVSYVKMPLDAGDFSLLDRRVVSALNSMPESQRFIRGLRAWVGFRQIGVPYVRPERMFGKTTNSLIKNLAWARRGILSFSYVPLELITLVALGMVIISAVAIVAEIIVRIVNPHSAPSGFTTLIVLILLIGGIQMLFLGVIGSYLAHIYEEVKRRPAFIVESILNRPEPAKPPGSEPDPEWN